MLRVRLLFTAPFLALCLVPSARAHRLEPISTRFACPFQPGAGNLQVGYEYERFAPEGIGVHLAPVAEFELGLTSRTQFSLEMPLIVETHPQEPATAAAGHLKMSFRYLLAGSERKSYAISINPFVEAPTGNQRFAGDAVAVGVALHFDKGFGPRVLFHGNYGWSSTIGGSEEPERVFRYNSALVFPLARHWNPVVELLGATDTATGPTEVALQPELIYSISPHWELKVGVPFGLTQSSPGVGVRAQIAWIFGHKGSD